MFRFFLPLALLCLALPANSPALGQDLELASPFGDHMVLQRELPLNVWGWSKPHTHVEVVLADQTATTQSDDQGRWQLQLKPMPAGGPFTMTTTSEGQSIALEDVLVGEVWICSGQSNMQMGYGGIPEIKDLAQKAKSLPIRCLSVRQDVAFEPQAKCHARWIVGPGSSAVATTFAYDLQQALDVPVAVIETSWGSSSIEGWMPRSMAPEMPHFAQQLKQLDTQDHDRVAKLIQDRDAGKKWILEDNIYLRTRPNLLYNAMLYPLAPYTVRGMVWYQGEANAGSLSSMKQYGETLPAWTKHLRSLWTEDLQVLAVMLPRYGHIAGSSPTKEVASPTGHSWAWFRESQAKLLTLPNTGIANTIDLGDVKDIHPKDKRPIGKRLALIAENLLNPGSVEASGPTFAELKLEGSAAVVKLSHAEGLQTNDGKSPTGFWIAGKDRQWKPAEAEIAGESIRLTHPEVPQPTAVRYAFAAFPEVNLVNAQQLPAVPFRTDDDQP
ncbi:sialate O-acetylesterase [Bremerella cremea]|uniref:Sialate O-acetylesterase n=1 Tax=Bremerella cremea TaxID=1031537 RepID=A0A368KJW9_9BACT|nr:sialate O-acetylesterase [Bremerella cremea]RCS41057.1 sialate O-acetylesterase [Bremerella cremea]